MEKTNTKELLKKYKRLCRKVIYSSIGAELEEVKQIELELVLRFTASGLLEEFKSYQELVFSPPDTFHERDVVLDKYYSALIDLEHKLA